LAEADTTEEGVVTMKRIIEEGETTPTDPGDSTLSHLLGETTLTHLSLVVITLIIAQGEVTLNSDPEEGVEQDPGEVIIEEGEEIPEAEGGAHTVGEVRQMCRSL